MPRTLCTTTETVWFQPIVDTFEHRVLGHECPPHQNLRSVEGLCFVELPPGPGDALALRIDATVARILDSGLPPRNVIFELAEPELVREPAQLRRTWDEMRNRGFGMAVTGAGVSAGAGSLQMIRELLPNYVKLDERLAQNIQHSMCASMIGRLVGLTDRWGLRVIADGVARQSAVEDLWLLGVRFMQGALFGEAGSWPLSSQDEHHLDERRRYTRSCHLRSTPRLLTSKA